MADKDFLGVGISYPFRFTTKGASKIGVDTTREEIHVLDSVRQILGTRIGERVMRRDFGSRIHDLVFMPLDDLTATLAVQAVVDDLTKWEPRIIIDMQNVEILVNPREAKLTISMVIEFITTNTTGNFVFPFFLNEEGRIQGVGVSEQVTFGV